MNFLNQLKLFLKFFNCLLNYIPQLRGLETCDFQRFLFSVLSFSLYLILYLLTFLFPPLLSNFVLLSHLSFPHSHLTSHHIYILFYLMPSVIRSTFVFETNKFFLKRDRKVKKLKLFILQNTQKQPT